MNGDCGGQAVRAHRVEWMGGGCGGQAVRALGGRADRWRVGGRALPEVDLVCGGCMLVMTSEVGVPDRSQACKPAVSAGGREGAGGAG